MRKLKVCQKGSLLNTTNKQILKLRIKYVTNGTNKLITLSSLTILVNLTKKYRNISAIYGEISKERLLRKTKKTKTTQVLIMLNGIKRSMLLKNKLSQQDLLPK